MHSVDVERRGQSINQSTSQPNNQSVHPSVRLSFRLVPSLLINYKPVPNVFSKKGFRMTRIRTNEGRRWKCIQLTWKGVEYALKVINGNSTVFVVSENSLGCVDKRLKRMNRCCRLQYCFLIALLTKRCNLLSRLSNQYLKESLLKNFCWPF